MTASRPRGAEAVELDAGDGVRVAGRERGGLGDVAALVTDRRDARRARRRRPGRRRGEGLRSCDLVEQPDDQVDRLDLVEAAVLLALAAGRADRVVHERFCCHRRPNFPDRSGPADSDSNTVNVQGCGPCDAGLLTTVGAMPADAFFLLAGGCLLLAVLLPAALRSYAISPPLVLLVVGVALGWTPLADDLQVDLVADRALVEHVTELTVLIALMGVGLALDRPLDLLRPASWRAWSPTWRLLGVAMPLCILGVALLGWALGLPVAAALVLGSVLAPTDPVLASDVQVGGPGSSIPDEAAADLPYAEDPTVSSESGEVRFALTSEAGLNDGLTFPFVHAAVLVAAGGSVLGGVGAWLAWYVVGKIAIGVGAGVLVGRLLARVAFRSSKAPLRLAEQGEPLLALAALLTAYGVAQVAQGYGFLAVFACAMAMRSAERKHDYHRAMHEVVERLERLFTLLVLLLLGIEISGGVLDHLDWRGVLVGVVLLFVIRPLSGIARARRAAATQPGVRWTLAPRPRRGRVLRRTGRRVDLLPCLGDRADRPGRGALAVVHDCVRDRAVGGGPRHRRDARDEAARRGARQLTRSPAEASPSQL